MSLTRRRFAGLAAAAALTPAVGRAAVVAPTIIFEAAGAPDRAALEAAIARGADLLGVGVVAASDGGLAAAPEIELSAFTDVGRRPEFAGRRRTQAGTEGPPSGWFASDFTLAELRSLAVGPAPKAARAAAPTLLSLQEVIDIARAGCVREGRVIGVAARLVRPAWFAGLDLALEPRLAALIRLAGYDSPAAAMIVASSEPGALRSLGELTRARRLQLTDLEGGPADAAAPRYAAMLNPEGLAAVRGWAEAIAVPLELIVAAPAKGPPVPTGLAEAAHAARLAVFARGAGPRERLAAALAAGADGVITADVGNAAKVRSAAIRRRQEP
jgi:glycerophosphoryl diester phosphodiesterase